MTASTAPTQPPDKWEYCNQHLRPHTTGWCTVGEHNKITLEALDELSAWRECFNAGYIPVDRAAYRELYSAATALRAELAEVKQANHVLSHQLERRADGMDDLTQHLRAERDAALARLAELQAVGRNLIQTGLEYTDDLGKWCIGCGEIYEWAGDHYAINHKPDCPVMALTAALASGAVVEGEVTK